jgi:hypothetical protein
MGLPAARAFAIFGPPLEAKRRSERRLADEKRPDTANRQAKVSAEQSVNPYDLVYSALDELYDAVGRGAQEQFLENRHRLHHTNLKYVVSNLVVGLRRAPPARADRLEIRKIAAAIKMLEKSVLPSALDENNVQAVTAFYEAMQGIESWLEGWAISSESTCSCTGPF